MKQFRLLKLNTANKEGGHNDPPMLVRGSLHVSLGRVRIVENNNV